MALQATASTSKTFPICPSHSCKSPLISPIPASLFIRRITAPALALRRRRSMATAGVSPPEQQQQVEEERAQEDAGMASEWGKVSAVLFDMDGVICNSEELSRRAAVDVFTEMGVSVVAEDFVPFMGTGEAKFLGGVASVKGVKGFDPNAAKKRFFEIYLNKYAKPESGIGFPGAIELITECKRLGLKVAVASSADRIKVDANLAAAGLPISIFDAIVSADAFENLKPAPDIFLAASKILGVSPSECVVIEDALAGVQAAKAAGMRCIAVTTTLSEEKLQQETPAIIRKEIGDVSVHDIQHGGLSGCTNEKMDIPHDIGSLKHATSEMLILKEATGFDQGMSSTSEEVSFLGGLLGSRRDILKYGSLGVAVSCFLYTITNWKVMQYASLKGVLNLLSGSSGSIFNQNKGESRASRIPQLKEYLSDLEARGSASNVPEFPSKLDWLNTAPLQFQRIFVGAIFYTGRKGFPFCWCLCKRSMCCALPSRRERK